MRGGTGFQSRRSSGTMCGLGRISAYSKSTGPPFISESRGEDRLQRDPQGMLATDSFEDLHASGRGRLVQLTSLMAMAPWSAMLSRLLALRPRLPEQGRTAKSRAKRPVGADQTGGGTGTCGPRPEGPQRVNRATDGGATPPPRERSHFGPAPQGSQPNGLAIGPPPPTDPMSLNSGGITIDHRRGEVLACFPAGRSASVRTRSSPHTLGCRGLVTGAVRATLRPTLRGCA